jgi:glutamine synthetase type III
MAEILEQTSKTGSNHKNQQENSSSRKISDIFGENIFDLNTLKSYVSEDTYHQMISVVLQQKPIEAETVEKMSEAMILHKINGKWLVELIALTPVTK